MKNKKENFSVEKKKSDKKPNNSKDMGSKSKSPEKMLIKIDLDTQKEIEKEEKKSKKIFNNKKNNGICSQLLRTSLNQEKELIMLPYAKEKQKINKTINTIGNANGISYPTCSVIKGCTREDQNYLPFLRNDDKKRKKKNKLMNYNRKEYKAEINLDNDVVDDNNLKKMLGNAKNIQNFL